MMQFNYEKAFSRNPGWITKEEQKILRGKKVAIAGIAGLTEAEVRLILK